MNWIDKYRNKKCKTIIGKYFQRLFFTWLYKILTSIAFVLIGSIALKFTTGGLIESIFISIYGVGLVSLILIALTFITYAWIINPIRNIIKNKKRKKRAIKKICEELSKNK